MLLGIRIDYSFKQILFLLILLNLFLALPSFADSNKLNSWQKGNPPLGLREISVGIAACESVFVFLEKGQGKQLVNVIGAFMGHHGKQKRITVSACAKFVSIEKSPDDQCIATLHIPSADWKNVKIADGFGTIFFSILGCEEARRVDPAKVADELIGALSHIKRPEALEAAKSLYSTYMKSEQKAPESSISNFCSGEACNLPK